MDPKSDYLISDMSCTSIKSALKLTLIVTTVLVFCAFIVSIAWLIRTRTIAANYKTYYLPKVNLNYSTSNGDEPSMSTGYSDLVKLEIAMRRVEENSRRLREYTRTILWDNKDKSLWCVLFKEGERMQPIKPRPKKTRKKVLPDEEYLRELRKRLSNSDIIHFRHHGTHHRRKFSHIHDIDLSNILI